MVLRDNHPKNVLSNISKGFLLGDRRVDDGRFHTLSFGPNMNKELNFAEVQLHIGKIFFLVPML